MRRGGSVGVAGGGRLSWVTLGHVGRFLFHSRAPVFFHNSLKLFLGMSFPTHFQFSGFFGNPKGSHFCMGFLRKYRLSWKASSTHPLCIPLQRIGLTLQCLSPPICNTKKVTAPKLYFFEVDTKTIDPFFCYFKHVLRIILEECMFVDFWIFLDDVWKFIDVFLGKYFRDRFGTSLAFILDWCCIDFMNMIGAIRIGGICRKAFTICSKTFFK